MSSIYIRTYVKGTSITANTEREKVNLLDNLSSCCDTTAQLIVRDARH